MGLAARPAPSSGPRTRRKERPGGLRASRTGQRGGGGDVARGGEGGCRGLHARAAPLPRARRRLCCWQAGRPDCGVKRGKKRGSDSRRRSLRGLRFYFLFTAGFTPNNGEYKKKKTEKK
jgi:hypothetical protein